MRLSVRATVDQRGLDTALEVAPGETVALLGPNGAGKSTLLSIVAGLLRPDTGRVVLGDRVLTDTDTKTWVAPHHRRVGLLAQDPLLFPHLTALDNVAFGPRSTGERRAQARASARGWLERVGTGDLADRKATALSGGQAQRVAIARALAAGPDLLLLDEPLAALDVDVAPLLRHRLAEVLRGRTAVIATHDVLDALLLADRVAVVEDGRVVEHGPTHDLLSRPRSAFGARIAGLNLVRGTWHDDRVVTPEGLEVQGLVQGRPPLPGAEAVAVFRPTAVAVFLERVAGSPRTTVETEVERVEPRGDLVRVQAGALSADVTPQAAASLGLRPGLRVALSVKATEVSVYAAD